MDFVKSILIPEVYLPIIYIILGYISFVVIKKLVTTVFDRQKRINIRNKKRYNKSYPKNR